MNSVVEVGRLTSDVKVEYGNNNKPYARFTIAVSRTFKNNEGKHDTDFINCMTFGNLALNLAEYQQKGSQIGIQGSIRVDKYKDKEGNNKTSTYILANSITFLDHKKETTPASDIVTDENVSDPFKDFGTEVVITDDDLPF